ncbi:MAG TPA: hypothetical protein VIJ34_06000 [Acidimicrobiales bacterium]
MTSVLSLLAAEDGSRTGWIVGECIIVAAFFYMLGLLLWKMHQRADPALIRNYRARLTGVGFFVILGLVRVLTS